MPKFEDMEKSAEQELRRDYIETLRTHTIRQLTLFLFYFAGAIFLCTIVALVLDSLK